jgi:hypothetical protein
MVADVNPTRSREDGTEAGSSTAFAHLRAWASVTHLGEGDRPTPFALTSAFVAKRAWDRGGPT